MNQASNTSPTTQLNAESHKAPSRAFPVTLLVCGILTTLIAACVIPALLSKTGHLTLPSSFAWVDSIGTRYIAAIMGTSGALGLSMIALSIRSFRQTKSKTKTSQEPEQQQPSTAQTSSPPTTVQQKSRTTLILEALNDPNSVKIADLEEWSELTEETAQRLGLINPATMNLKEDCFGFFADDHMVKSGTISQEDFQNFRGMASTYVVARTNEKLVFMGKIDNYQERVKFTLTNTFKLQYHQS